MKKLRSVSVLEVKRAFVVPQLMRAEKGKKRYLRISSSRAFKQALRRAKRKVRTLTSRQLDSLIARDYPKRLKTYDAVRWYIGTVSTTDVGVWKRAGSLPLAWTRGSLADTARLVRAGLGRNDPRIRARARRALTDMLAHAIPTLSKERYLWPIIFSGGAGTQGRRGLTRMKGDIDDGCMRSIALAVSGASTLRAYLGVPQDH